MFTMLYKITENNKKSLETVLKLQKKLGNHKKIIRDHKKIITNPIKYFYRGILARSDRFKTIKSPQKNVDTNTDNKSSDKNTNVFKAFEIMILNEIHHIRISRH